MMPSVIIILFVPNVILWGVTLYNGECFLSLFGHFSPFMLQFLSSPDEHQQIIELNECIIIYVIQFSQDCRTI